MSETRRKRYQPGGEGIENMDDLTEEFEKTALRSLAERCMTPRQYLIWTQRAANPCKTLVAIQDELLLECSVMTIQRELKRAEARLAEALKTRQEGEARLGVTIAVSAHETMFAEDDTLCAVIREMPEV